MSRRGGRRRKTIPPVPAEPALEWIEWGGQLIFAVAFTAGGAPIGPTWDEIDAMLELKCLERLGPPDGHEVDTDYGFDPRDRPWPSEGDGGAGEI